MNQIINLIVLLLIFISGIFLFLIFPSLSKSLTESNKLTKSNVQFCGTYAIKSKSENLEEGKMLFRNNCASCHDKSMKRDMTGPKLKEFALNWDNDTTLILNYLRQSSNFLDTTKMDHILNLKSENYKDFNSHEFQSISRSELKCIMEYIDL